MTRFLGAAMLATVLAGSAASAATDGKPQPLHSHKAPHQAPVSCCRPRRI